ncbi:MAG: J domain-containing protein [Actinomycetota bacterium]|nr:J domain-containing protein [Actinomycetota bacterium]
MGTPTIDRLHPYLADRIHVDDGHWLWTGSNRNGYGTVRWPPPGTNAARTRRQAHRVVWNWFADLDDIDLEPIPHGWDLDHVCQHRACVRPGEGHTEPVDPATNQRRRARSQERRRTGTPPDDALRELLADVRRIPVDQAAPHLADVGGWPLDEIHAARRRIGAVSVSERGGWVWIAPDYTLFEILGVDPTATPEKCAARARDLKRRNHPDLVARGQDNPDEDVADAEETARLIAQAEQICGEESPTARARAMESHQRTRDAWRAAQGAAPRDPGPRDDDPPPRDDDPFARATGDTEDPPPRDPPRGARADEPPPGWSDATFAPGAQRAHPRDADAANHYDDPPNVALLVAVKAWHAGKGWAGPIVAGVACTLLGLWIATRGPVLVDVHPDEPVYAIPNGDPVSVDIGPGPAPLPEPAEERICWDESNTMPATCPTDDWPPPGTEPWKPPSARGCLANGRPSTACIEEN